MIINSITVRPGKGKSSGVALVLVIAVTFLVSLLIGLMMTQYILKRRQIQTVRQKIQAFYTTEAGLKKALYYLRHAEIKGSSWRTGDFFQDSPIREKVFYDRDDEAEISVLDDFAFLRIRSRAVGQIDQPLQVLIAGVMPEAMKSNLLLVSAQPLILYAGSQLNGLIKLNHEPIYQGGAVNGILETGTTLTLPDILDKPFSSSAEYMKYLLGHPQYFEVELHSPRVFSPQNPLPANRVFVNDAVLLENRDPDLSWRPKNNLTLASTAEIQISGWTIIANAKIAAIGPVRFLDNSKVISSYVYSETGIEITGSANISGMLIAPEIKISKEARCLNPTIIYCGPPFKAGRITLNNDSLNQCCIVNLNAGKNSRTEIIRPAKLEGLVYSRAPITLSGEVTGYVFGQTFYEANLLPDTTKTNILTGIIKQADTSDVLTIPVIFEGIRDFRIIQWLNR